MEVIIIKCKMRSYKDKGNLVSVHRYISEQHCINEPLFVVNFTELYQEQNSWAI
jgi:hypothetical protein